MCMCVSNCIFIGFFVCGPIIKLHHQLNHCLFYTTIFPALGGNKNIYIIFLMSFKNVFQAHLLSNCWTQLNEQSHITE